MPDHVQSLNTKHEGIDIPVSKLTNAILPGDTAVVYHGAYKGVINMQGQQLIQLKNDQIVTP